MPGKMLMERIRAKGLWRGPSLERVLFTLAAFLSGWMLRGMVSNHMTGRQDEQVRRLQETLGDPEHLAAHIKEKFLCKLPSDPACGNENDSFRRFERAGIHVLPVHFYSIVPEVGLLNRTKFERPHVTADMRAMCSRNPGTCPVPQMPSIDMNINEQVRGMGVCEVLKMEFEAIPSRPKRAQDGGSIFHSRWACSQSTPADQPCTPFGAIDSQVYHCFVRGGTGWQGGVPPKKVIEIGSGHSTYIAAAAMKRNAEQGVGGSLVSIEPFPSPTLRQGFEGILFMLIEKNLQDVDLTEFLALEEGDILFVDSTHIAVPGSDVVYIFTKIIPSLAPGVIVHVHDISLPFETAWDWTFQDYRFWNEQYLLQAFLVNNHEWEVLYMGILWQHYFVHLLEKIFPLAGSNGGFWMRKRPTKA